MSLQVHGHPLSSYCQKVLIAFHENATPFEFSQIHWDDATSVAEFERLWPLKRMPVLQDGQVIVRESSIVSEYLALHHPGPVLPVSVSAGCAGPGLTLAQSSRALLVTLN